MPHYFRQLTHKIAVMLIAVVLLQFAVANLGAHQLHLGEHEDESENHPHLEFTAQVTSLAECVDCICSTETDFDLPSVNDASTGQTLDILGAKHNHLVSKTETQTFDLCLDCQCHGGHVTAMSITTVMPSIPKGDALIASVARYLPPEGVLNYRPPIV